MSETERRPVEVSVIVPAHNRARLIGRALVSALAQEGVRSMEILIGDDASEDDTAAVAARVDPRVRVFRLERNSGAAAARNRAMREATGEFLAFLDSDDEWLPGKLAAQLDLMRRDAEAGVCATGHFLHKMDGTREEHRGVREAGLRLALHSAQGFHGASTPLVRRDLVLRTGGQDERLRVLEDWDWMLRLAARAPVAVLEEPLAVIHENTPSNPDFTWQSTEIFLEKHRAEFLTGGRGHAAAVVSQHWENASVNQFLHDCPRRGLSALLRSISAAPGRNPRLVAAVPIAIFDALTGSGWIRKTILSRRKGGR